MRKYRSGGFHLGSGVWSVSQVLKKTNFLYLFVSWNVFAYCAYNWYQNKKVKDKDKWARMSSGDFVIRSISKLPMDHFTIVKWPNHLEIVQSLSLLPISQRYLSLMMKPEDQLRVVKFKGLHHVESTSLDAATYLDPDKNQKKQDNEASLKS